MADQQQRAVIVGQHFLQQIQGIHVEIVGGLVQHQQIGGLGQQLGQQEACPFPARQDLHRRVGLAASNRKSCR